MKTKLWKDLFIFGLMAFISLLLVGVYTRFFVLERYRDLEHFCLFEVCFLGMCICLRFMLLIKPTSRALRESLSSRMFLPVCWIIGGWLMFFFMNDAIKIHGGHLQSIEWKINYEISIVFIVGQFIRHCLLHSRTIQAFWRWYDPQVFQEPLR